MRALRIHDRAIYALVALFLLLGGLYSVITPIFEAGDEIWHYPYVRHLAQGNGLPVQDPAQKQLWEQEGGQPPLYYALAAALTFWIDARDLEERLWRNPYARIGIPLAYGNKNLIVHTRAENFPWQGTTLAVHLIRLLSVCFGAGTVLLTFYIARESRLPTADHLLLLAAAFVAFNPMFLFISASVNNDSLAALLATGALYLIVQLPTRGVSNRRLLALGLVLGLAALTKVSTLGLIGVAWLVLGRMSWQAREGRLFLRGGATILILVLSIAGWWYARNYLLYRDPLAFNVWLQIAGGRPPQTLLGLLDEFQGFRISFWGNFGGVNLIAPEWVYTTLDVITLAALLGLLIGLWKRELPTLLWIPALWLGIIFVALIRWTLLTYASQGRLIFPAIAGVGILLAFGLQRFTFHVSRFTFHALRLPFHVSIPFLPTILPFTAIAFLFAFALAAPFLIIAPAYAWPPRLPVNTVVPNPVYIRYEANGAQPELVGVEVGRQVKPGGELPMTLYWRTDTPIAQDLYVYIHLYDSLGERIGQWDAFPGNGLYPTRLWQVGEVIVDCYRVPVRGDVAPQQMGRVEVGLARVGSTIPLVARDPQGEAITPTVARFGIGGATDDSSRRVNAAPRFTFGAEFDLLDLQLTADVYRRVGDPSVPLLRPGDVVRITYSLRAREAMQEDYTIFAHLVDAGGRIVAQFDAPPRGGRYPTSLWAAGEVVDDTFEFSVPPHAAPGEYALRFGLYRARDGKRLAVRGNTSQAIRAMDDYVQLAPISLAP